MSEFVRARSAEQKEARMEEVKQAADRLFSAKPYHDITLTTIAAELSWTRANLYKYVTSKEDIFLLLCGEKMSAYMDALLAAFPPGCGYAVGVYAEVWAGILSAHRDYLRYGDILSSIIETNVSVDRLAEFKALYFEKAGALAAVLAQNLGIRQEEACECILAVYFHAVGICSMCCDNPLLRQALERAGIAVESVDFQDNMKRFIAMNLEYYGAGRTKRRG